jgi:hypothetical protein
MQLQLQLYLACNPHVFSFRRSAKPLTMGCENGSCESLVRNKGKLPINVMICQFWSDVKIHENNAGTELYPNRDGKLSRQLSHTPIDVYHDSQSLAFVFSDVHTR